MAQDLVFVVVIWFSIELMLSFKHLKFFFKKNCQSKSSNSLFLSLIDFTPICRSRPQHYWSSCTFRYEILTFQEIPLVKMAIHYTCMTPVNKFVSTDQLFLYFLCRTTPFWCWVCHLSPLDYSVYVTWAFYNGI